MDGRVKTGVDDCIGAAWLDEDDAGLEYTGVRLGVVDGAALLDDEGAGLEYTGVRLGVVDGAALLDDDDAGLE